MPTVTAMARSPGSGDAAAELEQGIKPQALPLPYNKNLPPRPHPGISFFELIHSHFLRDYFSFNQFTGLC